MSPTARRPGGRSARVRAAVLEATLLELRDAGFAGLTMEGVARRAGVNKTTLYRRWGERERLIADAMLERARRSVPVPDTGALRGDLRALARAVAADLRTAEAQAVLRAVASSGAARSALADAARAFWSERFRVDGRIVERAIERGEVAPGTDPKVVIEALLGPIYLRVLVTRDELDDAFVERLVEFTAAGLGARA